MRATRPFVNHAKPGRPKKSPCPHMAHEEKHDDRAKLYDLMEKIGIAMLTTVETDGSLHTRPMGFREADAEGDLWFFADKTESVAKNVAANPRVGLGFSDTHGNVYVAVSGTGTLVDDRATIDEKWVDSLKAWFPKGKDDPSIVLLRVSPEKGEYWNSVASPLVVAVGFVKAKLTGKPADDLVEQAKVEL